MTHPAMLARDRELPPAVRRCQQRGYSAWEAGRRDESLDWFRKAAEAAPQCMQARQAFAFVLAMTGDLSASFRETAHIMAGIDPHPLTWAGQRLNGETVLIKCDGAGFGDVLQYARYLPMAAARGARVVVQAPQELASILKTVPGVTETFSGNRWRLPMQYYRQQILSLPYVFDTTQDTIPNSVPYIHADPAPWEPFLASLPGLKIGICWAGQRGKDANYLFLDDHRSTRLADMAPLLNVPGCSFVSLQLGPPAAELAKLAPGFVHDVARRLRDWTDTASLISGLDLVIAVDTAVCHLAGALGKPVWLLNKHFTCWRWFQDRSDSPWYPSMRIFRQPRPGDWASVIGDVARDLSHLSDAFSSPDIIHEDAIQ